MSGELRFTATVVGQPAIDRAFTRLRARFDDFSQVFEKLGADVREILKQQFDAQGRPQPWVPLSPVYAAWKAQHYPGKTILRRTDRLYEALTRKGFTDNVSVIEPTQAFFGAEGLAGRIGYYHQLGTRRMPQRRIFDLTEEDKRMLTKTIHEEMVKLGAELGFGLG
jgi:phage gpG-like protein